jgi:hypothetical protein
MVKPFSFYTVYMISFSLNCCAETPSFQVYMSPSQLSTLNENMKQLSGCHTRTETQRELIQITVNHLHVYSQGDSREITDSYLLMTCFHHIQPLFLFSHS